MSAGALQAWKAVAIKLQRATMATSVHVSTADGNLLIEFAWSKGRYNHIMPLDQATNGPLCRAWRLVAQIALQHRGV